jgi:phenylpropionate dioxygenase-like ring-hydroxylating dioxygenase large terminal subunit
MFENFNDGYHANKLHHTIQDFCPSELARFPEPWDDASNVVFRTNGYIHIDGGFNATTKALMPIFPRLTEEERSRSTFALLPPSLCFGTAPDQAFFFIVRPKTPNTVDIEIGYLFHPTALEHPMFDYLFKMSDAGVQVFVAQDTDATTKVQRGMRSQFAARGRYSWQEESHVQFNRWLVQRYQRHWPSAKRNLKLVEERSA